MICDFWYSLGTILIPDQSLMRSPGFLSLFPPTPNNNHTDVGEVKPDEEQRFPQKKLAVPKNGDDQTNGGEEEPDVPQKWVFLDFEGPNDAHRAHHAANDERSGSEQLSNRQTSRVAPHGRKGREQVGTTVSESKECHASNVFVQPESLSDRGEVRAEKVGSAYAERRKKEYEPDGEACKNPWSGFRSGAKVALGIMDGEEGIRAWTFFFYVSTLIFEGQRGGSTLMMSTSPVSEATPGRTRASDTLSKCQIPMEPERGRTFSPDSSDSEIKKPLRNKDTLALKSWPSCC